MAERRKLFLRGEELMKELSEINKRLHEIGDPYHIIADKFESLLGVRPPISRHGLSKTNKHRIRLMDYLIQHNYTPENPISYQDLTNALGLQNLGNILQRENSFSPLNGGLGVNEVYHAFNKRSRITGFYIVNIEKAKTYVALMKELISLPQKSS